MRDFSCRDGEFDVAIGLDKTTSFSIATMWHCVARGREGQAHTIEVLCRDKLLTVAKKKKKTPWDWGVTKTKLD